MLRCSEQNPKSQYARPGHRSVDRQQEASARTGNFQNAICNILQADINSRLIRAALLACSLC